MPLSQFILFSAMAEILPDLIADSHDGISYHWLDDLSIDQIAGGAETELILVAAPIEVLIAVMCSQEPTATRSISEQLRFEAKLACRICDHLSVRPKLCSIGNFWEAALPADQANAVGSDVVYSAPDLMNQRVLPEPLNILAATEHEAFDNAGLLQILNELERRCSPAQTRQPANPLTQGVENISALRRKLIARAQDEWQTSCLAETDQASIIADLRAELDWAKRLSEAKQAEADTALFSKAVSDIVVLQLREEIEGFSSLRHASDSAIKQAKTEIPQHQSGSTSETAMPQIVESSVPVARKTRINKFTAWATRIFISPRTRHELRLIERSGLFDEEWYLATYIDLQSMRMPAALHYLKYGAAEFRDPSTKFSTQKHIWQNPDLDVKQMNPLVHFLTAGKGPC